MSTWNELIDLAFLDVGVIQPGESITTAMRTDAQKRLNELLASLSTEGATVYTQKTYTQNLLAGVAGYTVGAGGTFNTGERVQRISAWEGRYAAVVGGGPVLSLAEFGAALQAEQQRIAGVTLPAVLEGQVTVFPATITRPIPTLIGADTAFPLINMRVFPTPSAAVSITIAGWTPISVIADFTASPTLPSGWELMIHTQLALLLYPMYARQGGIPQELAAMALNAKSSIVNQNVAGKPEAK